MCGIGGEVDGAVEDPWAVVEGAAECHQSQPTDEGIEDRHPSRKGKKDSSPQTQGGDGEEEEGDVEGDVLEICAGGGGFGIAVGEIISAREEVEKEEYSQSYRFLERRGRKIPGIQRTNDKTSLASSSRSLNGEARSVNAAVAGASNCEGIYETGMADTGPYDGFVCNSIASVSV